MDIFSIIISGLSGVIAVGSLVFSLVTYHKAVVHDKKKDTIDAFNTLQQQAFDPLNLYQPGNIKEIAQDVRCAEYKKLSGYIARIEHFCVGVVQNIYDKETVYELAHGYFDGKALKNRLYPIIEKKHYDTNEIYYENIYKVWKWMDKETKKRGKSK